MSVDPKSRTVGVDPQSRTQALPTEFRPATPDRPADPDPGTPTGPGRERTVTLDPRPAANDAGEPWPEVEGYELLEEIGAGTFGRVFKAREKRTNVVVAIKFFHPRAGEWYAASEEMRRLALLAAAPGIVQLKDGVPDARRPYLVMSY